MFVGFSQLVSSISFLLLKVFVGILMNLIYSPPSLSLPPSPLLTPLLTEVGEERDSYLILVKER